MCPFPLTSLSYRTTLFPIFGFARCRSHAHLIAAACDMTGRIF